MLFKECFKIHTIEYRANQGNVFPKKSSYCKDHAIQGFVNKGPTVIRFQRLTTHLSKNKMQIIFFFSSIKSKMLGNRNSEKKIMNNARTKHMVEKEIGIRAMNNTKSRIYSI